MLPLIDMPFAPVSEPFSTTHALIRTFYSCARASGGSQQTDPPVYRGHDAGRRWTTRGNERSQFQLGVLYIDYLRIKSLDCLISGRCPESNFYPHSTAASRCSKIRYA
jgi:hypothetical protein